MQDLVRHVLAPVLAHPDDLQINQVDDEAVTIIEIQVHADDRAILEGDDERTLRSARTILSAAAGRRKATIELVDAFTEAGDAADDDSEDADEDSEETSEDTGDSDSEA